MADLLIVGSFAFDTINTQTARRENVLGGTGSHASYGASFYTKVFASGRVGGADWKDEDSKILQEHNINIENLQIVPGEKTTSWEAVYEADMNNRSTLSFCPNCCVEFHPNLTEAARKCPYIFLANNSPASQMEVIESAIDPKLIVCLGRIAAKRLIDPNFQVTKQHGQLFRYNGRLITATFHPAALLRNPANKAPTFSDFEMIYKLAKIDHFQV